MSNTKFEKEKQDKFNNFRLYRIVIKKRYKGFYYKYNLPPVVETANAGPSSTLSIKVNRWDTEPNETREERLLHVGELLEGHVLDDRRQLMVVTDHDPTLQPVTTILRVLKQQRDECFDFQNLKELGKLGSTLVLS